MTSEAEKTKTSQTATTSPLFDPSYELIEFPSRPYSNAPTLADTSPIAADEKVIILKCDLCGTSNVKLQCEMCVNQMFCLSCDDMYHRHPKRQYHIRKQIVKIQEQPPLPPKGEFFSAPIPPPRRNKRTSRVGTPNPTQQTTQKKDNSFMGSLKRFVGGSANLARSIPSQSRGGLHPTKFSSVMHPTEFQQRAQSMAQLNCPSCYPHPSSGMGGWDWHHRSQLNLNAIQSQNSAGSPWFAPTHSLTSVPWHGSAMFPTPSTAHLGAPTFVETVDRCLRRGSGVGNGHQWRKYREETTTESSEISAAGSRRSHRRTPASPAVSRRSRRRASTIDSDSDDDQRNHRYHGGSSSIKNSSPAMNRKFRGRRYDHDEEENGTAFVKSYSNRRNFNSHQKHNAPMRTYRRGCRINSSSNSAGSTSDESTDEDRRCRRPQLPERTISSISNNNNKTPWKCEHCTFLNQGSSKICNVCCKTSPKLREDEEEIKANDKKNNAAFVTTVTNVKNATKSDIKDAIISKGGNYKTGMNTTDNISQNLITQIYEWSPEKTSLKSGMANTVKVIENENNFAPEEFIETAQFNRNWEFQSVGGGGGGGGGVEVIKGMSNAESNLGEISTKENSTSWSNNQRNGTGTNEKKDPVEKQMNQGLEVVKLLKAAEMHNFSVEDLTAALVQCGEGNALEWLLDNWHRMIDTVMTLATNYGREQELNVIGTISETEAKEALRAHNGELWPAVTQCIRQRQQKYEDLMSRGNFEREDVVTMLTANDGDLDKAYDELNKIQLKPFLMRIWGPPAGPDNDSGNHDRHNDEEDGILFIDDTNSPNEGKAKSISTTPLISDISAQVASNEDILRELNSLAMLAQYELDPFVIGCYDKSSSENTVAISNVNHLNVIPNPNLAPYLLQSMESANETRDEARSDFLKNNLRDEIKTHREQNFMDPLPLLSELKVQVEGKIVSDEEKGLNFFNSDPNFERQIRSCLAEGWVKTYEQAELAVQLITLKFDRSQSIEAAAVCSDINSAITYLQQGCPLCDGKFPAKHMISMLECEHRCCDNCAQKYFTLQISEKSIEDCVCPFCSEPHLKTFTSDEIVRYFGHLDILLKTILDEDVHELFQRKLRDRALSQEPNFKWCNKCSSGFITDAHQKRSLCPDCKSICCAQCGNPWTREHENFSCDQYKAWIANNDPDAQLARHLEDQGVTCPQCCARFDLAKGGCMHLTCWSCKHEFCSDCSKPFKMGANCTHSEFCSKLGLHAHHPRNCLFFLRDKEPEELKNLLKENKITIDFSPISEDTRCNVLLQREIANNIVDSVCGGKILEGGLCRTHYIEHLAKLIRKNKIDPVVIFDLSEVLQEIRRGGVSLPIRASNMFEHEYRKYCVKIVKEKIPLDG